MTQALNRQPDEQPGSCFDASLNSSHHHSTYDSTHPLPGGLYVQMDSPSGDIKPASHPLAFPLSHTHVQAKIAGGLSRVQVTQRFENPFAIPLEAVYVLPLPDQAAVDRLTMRVGDRTFYGHIRPRSEAQRLYERAKHQGHTAALLEQERENVFTQSLANIQPGEAIEVTIEYSDRLLYTSGNYEFVFPMVVGPRYVPGAVRQGDGWANKGWAGGGARVPMTLNCNTDQVPDGRRLNGPVVPLGTHNPHRISVWVEIDAGVEVQDVRSPSHRICIRRAALRLWVRLADDDTQLNKDLIIRYRVTGKHTQASILTHTNTQGGHFALHLIPAVRYLPQELLPKEVIFLIDTSGSQRGEPLLRCQELMRQFIRTLNPNDTFNILDFSDITQQLSPVPLSNTPHHQQQAFTYIHQLSAGGGTELLRGIRTALNLPSVECGRLRSVVLLTDGYIGNENQVLAAVQRGLQPGTRFHSFGAGSAVNRFLLNRIAEIGRGVCHIVRHDEPVEEVAQTFCRQINNPVLTHLQVRWEGEGAPLMLYPSVLPDLFADQPLVIFGRKPDALPGTLHLTGITAGGLHYRRSFDLHFGKNGREETGNVAIAQLWGRARIKDLTAPLLCHATQATADAVLKTAIAYQLLSPYTAFVAVSDEVRSDPKQGWVSVQVPVEMPEGVRYEGIFSHAQPIPAPAVLERRAMDELLVHEKTRSLNDCASTAEIPLCDSVEWADINFTQVDVPKIPQRPLTKSAQASAHPCSIGPVQAEGGTRNQVEGHYQRALIYIQNEDWKNVTRELREAIRQNPKNSWYYALLGKVYLKQNLMGMARVYCRQALKLDPHEPLALSYAAQLGIQPDSISRKPSPTRRKSFLDHFSSPR